jgi:hypothetical protein
MTAPRPIVNGDAVIASVVQNLFTDAVRDDVLHAWHADHAGMSLVARLGADGTVASCREMPSAEAAALADNDPGRTLIVATWPGETR